MTDANTDSKLPDDGLTFSAALQHLQAGRMVARRVWAIAGWRESEAYVRLAGQNFVFGPQAANWNASVADMLSADWYVVSGPSTVTDQLAQQEAQIAKLTHMLHVVVGERDAEKHRALLAEQQLRDAVPTVGVGEAEYLAAKDQILQMRRRAETAEAEVARLGSTTEREAKEKSRADAAEQRVAEMRRVLGTAEFLSSFAAHLAEKMDPALFDPQPVRDFSAEAKAALDATAEIAGRWVPADAIGVTLVDGMRAERDAAIARAEKAEKKYEESVDWYSQRHNRLRQWVKEEVEPLSADAASRYFAIVANGSPAPFESADWANTLHAARLAQMAAVAERDEAVTKLNARDNEIGAEAARVLARAERARDDLQKRLDQMDRTARHIIAISNGNGGVESLGDSEVETAIRKMVLDCAKQVHGIAQQRDETSESLQKEKGETCRLGSLADERGVLLKEVERERDEAEARANAAEAMAANLDARLRDRCEDLVNVGNMNLQSSHRADAAEQAVTQLRELIAEVKPYLGDNPALTKLRWRIDAALDGTANNTGRWLSKEAVDAITRTFAAAEAAAIRDRDDAEVRANTAERAHGETLARLTERAENAESDLKTIKNAITAYSKGEILLFELCACAGLPKPSPEQARVSDRAAAAEQLVAELKPKLEAAHVVSGPFRSWCRLCQTATDVAPRAEIQHLHAADCLLARAEAVAGRWVDRKEYDRVLSVANDCFKMADKMARLENERDDAVAQIARIMATRNEQPALDKLADNLDRANKIRHDAERARDAALARVGTMETVASRIINVCNGNGGVESLGSSDVEAAIKKMVLSHVEKLVHVNKANEVAAENIEDAQASITKLRASIDTAAKILEANNLGHVQDALSVLRAATPPIFSVGDKVRPLYPMCWHSTGDGGRKPVDTRDFGTFVVQKGPDCAGDLLVSDERTGVQIWLSPECLMMAT